jgi:VCBS repeat-containing protein
LSAERCGDQTTATAAISPNGAVTLTGTTAEANDTIAVYDGTTLLGTTTTSSNGTWSFTTGKASKAVHTYTVTATDVAGNVGNSSNEAILAVQKLTPSLAHQATT